VAGAGPVEQGTHMFLSQIAHEDPAMSALAVSAAIAVDKAEPGTRPHAFAVESLRKVLAEIKRTMKPERDINDEFADLFSEVFSR
jgi:hypothetical protein